MKREDLLKSREYWIAKIQIDLFEMINEYMKNNRINQTQLAEKLGVSKGYISQILNGNFDHKISKLVDLSLALDSIPLLEFKNSNNFIEEDKTKFILHGNFEKTTLNIPVQHDLDDLVIRHLENNSFYFISTKKPVNEEFNINNQNTINSSISIKSYN